MNERTRVLVVGVDRALRANLTSLLRLEDDLEVSECGRQEAERTAAAWAPQVVLLCGAMLGRLDLAPREIRLTGPTPYEAVLLAIRA